MIGLQQRRNVQLTVQFKLLLVVVFMSCCACAVRLSCTDAAKIVYLVAISVEGLGVTASLICNCNALHVYSQAINRKQRLRSYGITAPPTNSTSLQLLTWDPKSDGV